MSWDPNAISPESKETPDYLGPESMSFPKGACNRMVYTSALKVFLYHYFGSLYISCNDTWTLWDCVAFWVPFQGFGPLFHVMLGSRLGSHPKALEPRSQRQELRKDINKFETHLQELPLVESESRKDEKLFIPLELQVYE